MKIIGLRPKGETVEDVRASLARAEGERSAAEARVAELTRDRGRRLLDGDAAMVARAEAELAEARADVERLDALLPVLRERLAGAEAAARVADAEAAVAEAERLSGDFQAWWRDQYPGLAASIRAGLLMEAAAGAAIRRAMEAVAEAARAGHSSDLRVPAQPSIVLWGGSPAALYGLGALVTLPPVDGPADANRAAFWPLPR